MTEELTLGGLLKRYFPTFIGVILAGCFAISGAIALAANTYFNKVELAHNATGSFIAALVSALVVVLSNLLVVRGRPWAIWIMIAIFMACLLTVLPTIQYRPHKFIYVESLFWPLLGLLLLNSKRHREMREKLLEIRHLRQAVKAAHMKRKR